MFLFNCCTTDSQSVGYQVSTSADRGNKFVATLPQNFLKDNNTYMRKIEKSMYSELVKKYQNSKEKWTDQEFPPDNRSLGKIQGLDNVKWKRIQQILPNPSLFDGKIEPKDVIQGNIGDCYFLSALAALAEEQRRIKAVFQDQPMRNAAGIYKVVLRINGQIKEFVVDDWIPVNKYGEPLFCQFNSNEFWVVILEKAWAKAHGSYANIIAGLPGQVLRAVSYAPTYTFDLQLISQRQNLWRKLIKYGELDYPMCAGTVENEALLKQKGLISAHAYTVLDAEQVMTTSGEKVRMVELRNPWGKKEWNGFGSDGDKFWDTVVGPKEKYLIYGGDDGIFHMRFEDFCTYFDVLDVCHDEKNSKANYLFQPVYPLKNASLVDVQVATEGEFFFELHQPTLRGESQARALEGMSRATLLIIAKQQTGYRYISGYMSREFADLCVKTQLQPGKYVLYCKFDKTSAGHLPKEASVSVYSKSKALLSPSNQKLHPNLLTKAFLSHAKSLPDKQSVGANMQIARKLIYYEAGFAYIAFFNDDKSRKKFVVQAKEENFTKLSFKLKKPFKKTTDIKFQVLPGNQQIILCRCSVNPAAGKIIFPPELSIQVVDI